jgi:hypothetical protein
MAVIDLCVYSYAYVFIRILLHARFYADASIVMIS